MTARFRQARRSVFVCAAVIAALISGSAWGQAALKSAAVRGVEARTKLAQEMTDSIFSFGELGFQEIETSRYITTILEQNGFKIVRGVAGMPTAWVATWTHGAGGPVIALGSDIDALPKNSQKPGVAWREPLIEDGPGHGEGHNSGQAVNVVAALAVKDLMASKRIAGTLMLWPGVAEELLAGKAYMVREGVFSGVDVVLFTHVGNNLQTFWGQPPGTGLVSVEFTFKGESSHAAQSPWRAKSALDAVELMNTGWNFRREHLSIEQRSHYVITDGGDQPNVVPPVASVWYFFRERTFEGIRKNYDIGIAIAEGAARMTDTTVSRRIIGTAAPQHFNRPLAQAAQANIERVGLPVWTEEEQTFARAVQRLVGGEEEGLKSKPQPLKPPEPGPGSGSDDIGDVSWTVPTIVIRYPSNISNVPAHNWSAAIAMATPIAHKGVVAGAKVVAMTTLDVLTQPALVRAAKTYFAEEQTREQKYVPMISATDLPQIQMNAERMAAYRERMRPMYYDPAKYPTYLDQLGVKWPSIQRPER
jgi:aminobenzoyl-glutamate utilization protein B